MDDLLIFSKTEEDHFKHLEIVLSRLYSDRLDVSRKKYCFMLEGTEFLGFLLERSGIRLNPAKAEFIRTWPKPKTLTEQRSFIGILQFLCRFLIDFSSIARH